MIDSGQARVQFIAYAEGRWNSRVFNASVQYRGQKLPRKPMVHCQVSAGCPSRAVATG